MINETAGRIETGVTMVDKAFRNFLEADRDFDVEEAKEYVRLGDQGIAAHERKYRCTLATVDERLTRDLAEAEYKLMDRNIKALERKLDAYRSIGTSVRQAYAVAGRGDNF